MHSIGCVWGERHWAVFFVNDSNPVRTNLDVGFVGAVGEPQDFGIFEHGNTMMMTGGFAFLDYPVLLDCI